MSMLGQLGFTHQGGIELIAMKWPELLSHGPPLGKALTITLGEGARHDDGDINVTGVQGVAGDHHGRAIDAAAGHVTTAREHAPNLPDGPYGDTVRAAIDEVADAIDRRDRTRRVSAPGATG